VTPGSFDIDTALELVGDAEARRLGAIARACAEAWEQLPDLPAASGAYWDGVMDEMRRVVMRHAYAKRKARLERKAGR
jgi:hypothetical protein